MCVKKFSKKFGYDFLQHKISLRKRLIAHVIFSYFLTLLLFINDFLLIFHKIFEIFYYKLPTHCKVTQTVHSIY